MTGFSYEYEIERNGEIVERGVEHNLIPTEGKNHMLSVVCNGGTQVPVWYVGIYEVDYAPTVTVTAATLGALTTECTAYDEAARPSWVESTPAAGATDNSASKAEFTMNASKTVYGCFLSSVASKSSGSGVLLSVVKFSTAKALVAGDILRVTAPVSLT